MSILSDRQIIDRCYADDPYQRPMITPFVRNQVKEDEDGRRIISYGCSSFGYDVRLAPMFKIFTNVNSTTIDPLNIDDACYVDRVGDYCIVPPNSYVLGHTIETFNIPRDILAVVLGKSTYARAGCAVNCTPLEPGFCGQVVVEVINGTTLPLKIYANMGIAQFIFLQGNEECLVSYADRFGKYQNQTGITPARV